MSYENKKAFFIAIYGLILSLITLFVRLWNPEMNETQLFIHFWYFWILILVSLIPILFWSGSKILK